MLQRDEVEHALDIQRKGYALLRWMEEAFQRGFLAPESARSYGTSREAGLDWLARQFASIPERARPKREHLEQFVNYFRSYLECSFDLETQPGQRLYSDHCLCPFCTWMVQNPYFRPKKLTKRDKRNADRLEAEFVRRVATALALTVSEQDVDQLVRDDQLKECIALCAYALDLQRRLNGSLGSPATLALWRRFAWTKSGSPKQDFVLTADAILAGQSELVDRVRKVGVAS